MASMSMPLSIIFSLATNWRSRAARPCWRKWLWPSVLSFFFHIVGAFHRKRDGCSYQSVGEHQLRCVDRVERQLVLHPLLVRNRAGIAVDADERAIETLASLALFLERALLLMPRPLGKNGRPPH